MDYYCSYYLKHYYYWRYCIYTPSDDEFVACVARNKSCGTPPLHMIQQTYNLVVKVLGLGLRSVVV